MQAQEPNAQSNSSQCLLCHFLFPYEKWMSSLGSEYPL